MIGPRSMGAGAYTSRPAAGESNGTRQPGEYANDTFRTVDAYGGIAEATLTPAQRLIERYERMSTPPPETPPKNATMKSTRQQQILSDSEIRKRHGHSRSHTHGPAPRASIRKEETSDFKKEPSPIRQSLRNLLSVLKKGAGGISKRKSDDKLSVPPGSQGHQTGDDAEASEALGSSAPPRRKMAGQLLYLTRETPVISPDVPGPLVWTSCSVTLESNKLVVSSFADDMQLVVHEVSLTRCTDIRSVPASQLSEAEAALLEAVPDGSKMQIFEIIFKGKPKEKFAAKSVRERAGWISAIWDGILPTKDGARANTIVSQKPVPQRTEDTVVIAPEVTTPRNIIQIESPRPVPLPQTSPLLTPSYSDRSLPPLPPPSPVPQVTAPLAIPDKDKKRNTQNLRLDLSEFQNPISPSIYPATFATASAASTPAGGARAAATPDTNPQRLRIETGSLISPSIYPPTSRPVSIASGSLTPLPTTPGGGPLTPRSSCPNSPSVANLSQLSVVRQRLAQIERNHSELSRGSSLAKSHHRASTPTKSPLSATSRWSRQEAVFHNKEGRFTESPLPMSPVGSVKTPGADAARGAASPSAAPLPEQRSSRGSRPANEADDKLAAGKTSKSVTGDVAHLSKGIADIKNVLGGESGRPTIHQMVMSIEQRASNEKKSLRGIQDTLTSLDKRVNDVFTVVSAGNTSARDAPKPTTSNAGAHSGPAQEQQESIIRALKEVKDQLSAEFPALASKLKEIQGGHRAGSDAATANSISESGGTPAGMPDPQAILAKLDEIKALFSSRQVNEPGSEDAETPKRIDTILNLIQEDSNKQSLLAQQQADSVRYLNELNTWLEAFVNNGTSQIQGIAMNVDRLCKELGQDESQQSLVTDIRQLISGMKARDQNFAALQAAVHSLLEVLSATQTQHGADSQAIAGLIDRQRHDQEVMFRAFTAEISGEIKGERLRFVEAMKEATAINVQTHVEHFKQELGREVMAMTEEVGRLHREKQMIENQISDLFSFYSKQKQPDMMPLQSVPENVPLQPRQAYGGARANIPRSHNRLGSYPR